MFGAHELSKLSGDKQEELMVAQKYLWQNFDRLKYVECLLPTQINCNFDQVCFV
jgi:hypothetical protein